MQSQTINDNTANAALLLATLLKLGKQDLKQRMSIETQLDCMFLPPAYKSAMAKKIMQHSAKFLPTVISE